MVADIGDLTILPGLVSVLGLGGLDNCEFIYEMNFFAQRPGHF